MNASNIFNFSDQETFPPDLNLQLQHSTCSGRIAFSIANPLYERPGGYFECTFRTDYLEQCYDEYNKYGTLMRGLKFCKPVKEFTDAAWHTHPPQTFATWPTFPTWFSKIQTGPQHAQLGTSWQVTTGQRTIQPSYKTMFSSAIKALSFELSEAFTECVLAPDLRCDGYSHCLTDECNCKDSDVFYCNDNSGCVSFKNVCDGFQDCTDGSDECMCSDVIQCTFKDHQYCVPRSKYCFRRHDMYAQYITSGTIDCSGLMTESETNPITECFEKFIFQLNLTKFERPFFEAKEFEVFCNQTCDKDWTHFCSSLVPEEIVVSVKLDCNGPLNDPTQKGGTETMRVDPGKLCDGQRDCQGGADEARCKGRYYCEGMYNHWVMASEVCDNKKDCPQGDDECQGCSTLDGTSGVASDLYMVQNTVIRYYMVIAAVIIIILNIFAVYEVYIMEPESRTAKVDRLFLMAVCFYDMLMGCCMGFTFVKSMIFSGKYCLSDFDWRASLQCKLLGFCFSFAAHGSLATISLISLTRCYKCVFDRSVKVKFVGYITAACLIVNALHSALPIVPASTIQDIFRASMTFPNNPFIENYDSSEMDRIYNLYQASHNAHSLDVSLYTKLDKLNNISSKAGIFDPAELGYYSYSPLCIQNIYGVQSSLAWYKIIYMTSIGLLLAAVSISYIFIVYYALQTSNAQEGAGNQVNNNNVDLSPKIVLMIGSQLGCWIAVMALMTIYGFSQQMNAPGFLYEITATVLLPMNSYLNPIFNSSLYRKILALTKKIHNLIKRGELSG